MLTRSEWIDYVDLEAGLIKLGILHRVGDLKKAMRRNAVSNPTIIDPPFYAWDRKMLFPVLKSFRSDMSKQDLLRCANVINKRDCTIDFYYT